MKRRNYLIILLLSSLLSVFGGCSSTLTMYSPHSLNEAPSTGLSIIRFRLAGTHLTYILIDDAKVNGHWDFHYRTLDVYVRPGNHEITIHTQKHGWREISRVLKSATATSYGTREVYEVTKKWYTGSPWKDVRTITTEANQIYHITNVGGWRVEYRDHTGDIDAIVQTAPYE